MSDWRTRLRSVIEERKITLPDLANKANYDYVTLWKALVKERHTIKRTTMNRICQVLEVDPDYIWDGIQGVHLRHEVPILGDEHVVQWVDGNDNDKLTPDRIGIPYPIMSSRAFAWINTAPDMQGLVALNATVYCDPYIKPESMDYVLAIYRGKVVFRRYVEAVDQKYLMPHDPAFQAVTMGSGDRILAVAVGGYFSMVPEGRVARVEK